MNTGSSTGSILVTGAARGIGLAIADVFPAGGWRVGMIDVDVDGDAVTAPAAGRAGAMPGVLDVRDPDQWRGTLARQPALATYGATKAAVTSLTEALTSSGDPRACACAACSRRSSRPAWPTSSRGTRRASATWGCG